jgi:phospholipid/cholesterol/gamma-HCH transport system substrate-binding protein
METRANHVWVGAVSLILLAALAAFIIWIARVGEGGQKEYDIFFNQAVDGLSRGGTVTYAGVPAGQIQQIELWPKDPNFVRVRVGINEEVPILQGTVATIQASFTGVSNIQLNGGVRGAPPITEPGPNGVPVIPTKAGGLGAILSSAPLLLERLTTLTERLTLLLSDENQVSISKILANTDRITGNLANASPQVERTLAELQVTLRQATETLETFDTVGKSANDLLGEEGSSLANELRATLRSAQGAIDELKGTLSDARPAARQLSDTTLPAAEATLRDLRRAAQALRSVTEKVDERGAGALVGGNKLPDYEP